MRYLIFSFCLFYHFAAAQSPGPRVWQRSSAVLYEKLASGFAANRLFRLYRANLRLRRVVRNRHEPTVKDSILYVATAADRLELLHNRFTTLLYSATITSGKVSFAGMRVGASKAQFCRTLHLNPAYDVYSITDGMENFVQLRFTFASGKLQSAEFRPLINLDTID